MEIKIHIGEDTEDMDEINCQVYQLLELAEESGIYITQHIWQSKYNKLVHYEYEPFTSSGFIQVFTLEGPDEKMEFFKYLFTRHANNMLHLEACLKLDAVAH